MIRCAGGWGLGAEVWREGIRRKRLILPYGWRGMVVRGKAVQRDGSEGEQNPHPNPVSQPYTGEGRKAGGCRTVNREPSGRANKAP